MNLNSFEISSPPLIPLDLYREVKRCPCCQSVFLTQTKCEACERSLLYHPIGKAFGAKSFYGIKERYFLSLPTFVKYYPIFENKKDAFAKSYVRQLLKRFEDLLDATKEADPVLKNEWRYFYVELMALIDELLSYGVDPFIIQQKIEIEIMDKPRAFSQGLLLYLNESKKENFLSPHWKIQILNHKVGGFKIEYIVKNLLIAVTVISLAVVYYDVISSLFGK